MPSYKSRVRTPMCRKSYENRPFRQWKMDLSSRKLYSTASFWTRNWNCSTELFMSVFRFINVLEMTAVKNYSDFSQGKRDLVFFLGADIISQMENRFPPVFHVNKTCFSVNLIFSLSFSIPLNFHKKKHYLIRKFLFIDLKQKIKYVIFYYFYN